MKKKKLDPAILVAVAVPVILLLLWEYAGNNNLIKTTLLPTPSEIWKATVASIRRGTLQRNTCISLLRVLEGYLLGSALGILLGISMGLSGFFRKSMSILTGVLRPIPIIAWVPILILFLGIDEMSKVVVIAIGTFWPVLTNVMYGVRDVDVKFLEVSRLFVKSRREIICHVVIPAALPSIFSGLRTAIGIAWISVVGAELIASSSGLGFMISYARELSRADNMFSGVMIIGVIGWLINVLIGKLEKILLKWNVTVKKD